MKILLIVACLAAGHGYYLAFDSMRGERLAVGLMEGWKSRALEYGAELDRRGK